MRLRLWCGAVVVAIPTLASCRALVGIDVGYDDGVATVGGAGGDAAIGGGPATAGGEGGAGASGGGGDGGTGNVAVGGRGSCSTEFDGALDRECWSEEYGPGDSTQVSVAGGKLVLVPVADHTWWTTEQGLYVFTQMPADFLVVTKIRVDTPNTAWNLAGLAVRPAGGGDRNNPWVKYTAGVRGAGAMAGEGFLMVETTATGVSVYEGYTDATMIPADDVWIAFCRIGGALYAYGRADALDPFVLQPINLTGGGLVPMPGPVDVGMAASTWQGTPLLEANYDWIRFYDVSSQTECEAALDGVSD